MTKITIRTHSNDSKMPSMADGHEAHVNYLTKSRGYEKVAEFNGRGGKLTAFEHPDDRNKPRIIHTNASGTTHHYDRVPGGPGWVSTVNK